MQLDLIHATVNKTLFHLLVEQLRIIGMTSIPFISEDLFEKFESTEGDFDAELLQTLETPKRVVAALLSLRIRQSALASSTPAAPVTRADSRPPPSFPALSTSGLPIGAPRGSSVLPPAIPMPRALSAPVPPNLIVDPNDAKRKKKRRRTTSANTEDDPSGIYGPGHGAAPVRNPAQPLPSPTQQQTLWQPPAPLLPMPVPQNIYGHGFGPGIPGFGPPAFAPENSGFAPAVMGGPPMSGIPGPRPFMQPQPAPQVMPPKHAAPNPYQHQQHQQMQQMQQQQQPQSTSSGSAGTSTGLTDVDKAKLPLLQKLAMMMKSVKK